MRAIRGKKGNYPVRIVNFHKSDDTSDASFVATRPKVTTPALTIEEVRLKNREKTPRTKQRGTHSPEQFRQIEAKQKRLRAEYETAKELYVGHGPITVPGLMDEIRKIAAAKSVF
jgi:hypothetical protein